MSQQTQPPMPHVPGKSTSTTSTTSPIRTAPTSSPHGHRDPNVPHGLEFLTTLNHLMVQQQVDMLEVLAGFELNNKYVVKTKDGQKVFYVVEDMNLFSLSCGSCRAFDIRVFDMDGEEVIHFNRDLTCGACCPCCLARLEVSCPPGNVVGYVAQEWTMCKPAYRVENAAGDMVLRIDGPFCPLSIYGEMDFPVLSRDGTVEVGKISREWGGLDRIIFHDADTFGISFPVDLDVKMKAVMLGACLLIDFMYFERAKGRHHSSGHHGMHSF